MPIAYIYQYVSYKSTFKILEYWYPLSQTYKSWSTTTRPSRKTPHIVRESTAQLYLMYSRFLCNYIDSSKLQNGRHQCEVILLLLNTSYVSSVWTPKHLYYSVFSSSCHLQYSLKMTLIQGHNAPPPYRISHIAQKFYNSKLSSFLYFS